MKKSLFALITVLILCLITPAYAQAAALKDTDTELKVQVRAVGQYPNYDGVPTVAQFTDENGNFCFAYQKDQKIIVVKTENGKVSEKISLKMKGETPVYNDGAIYWCGNKYGDSSSKLYIFKLSV